MLEESVIVKELSAFFVKVAKPGGGVAPVDIKIPVTVEVFGPKHAARFSVVNYVI